MAQQNECARKAKSARHVYLQTKRQKHLSEFIDRLVLSDEDVWVERSYKSIRGEQVRYFLSMRGYGRLLSPPTGAAIVVYSYEIEEMSPMIQAFSKVPMTMDELRSLERPSPSRYPTVAYYKAPAWKRMFRAKELIKCSATGMKRIGPRGPGPYAHKLERIGTSFDEIFRTTKANLDSNSPDVLQRKLKVLVR